MSIHDAIANERLKQVRLLLDIGVNVNSRDLRGQTPLISACVHKNEDLAFKLVKLILRSRADKGLTDRRRRSAFSYVCELGRESVAALLLKEIDFDLNEADIDGNTPLMYSAISGNARLVRLLVGRFRKYRINIDARNNKGYTAYMLASKHGNFYCAHLLKTEGRASDTTRDFEFYLNAEEWAMKGANSDVAKSCDLVARPKTSPAVRMLKHRSSMPPLKTRSLTYPELRAPEKPMLRARSLTLSRLNSEPVQLHSTIKEEPDLEELWTERYLPNVFGSSSDDVFDCDPEDTPNADDCEPQRGKVLDLNKLFTYYDTPRTTPCMGWGPVPSNFLSAPSTKDFYKQRR